MDYSKQSERGATAILVAISLLLLMGMAALAIDVGAAFDDRRQQQSAADVGALAAVQYANTNFGASALCMVGTIVERSACRGAVEAMTVVAGTLNSRFTTAQWAACVDSGDGAYPRDSGVAGSGLSDCISFTNNLQKARVVLPTSQVNTTFGRVIGVNSIDFTSTAEAGADLNSSGDVIPFALGPTGSGSSQACLFANPTANLDVAPCNGPTEGNFGFLDIALYGNTSMGTSTVCTGDTQGRLATNLALGSDHELGKFTGAGDTIRNDNTFCPITTAYPNEVPTQTGGSNTGLENGFFRGINPPTAEGRLMCKDGDAGEVHRFPKVSGACTDVLNIFPEEVDDTPLWDFLTTAGATFAGSACEGTVPNPLDTRQEMEACLIAWKSTPAPMPSGIKPPLFEPEIIDSARFAAVPSLEFDPSNGTGNYLIMDFLPVYMETIYLGCNANFCDVVHSPGEPTSGPCPPSLTPLDNTCGVPANGNKNLRAVTSFILELDMLDPTLTAYWPSRPGTIEFNLIK